MEIQINQLKLDAIIGTLEHERKQTQPILLDISFTYDATKAACTDDLYLAIDYAALTEKISNFVAKSSFLLIEALAQAVLNIIVADTRVETASVAIAKPNAIELADTVRVVARYKK